MHYNRWRLKGDPLAGGPLTPHTQVCVVTQCSQKAMGRGYCNKHYSRWKRHGDPEATKRVLHEPTNCAAQDCAHQAVRWTSGEGLCKTHHGRWLRLGDPNAKLRLLPMREGRRIISEAVADRDRTECWFWDWSHNTDGYPLLSKLKVMHLAMELDGRPRPPAPANNGLHSCDNKGCWNPDHLRWGTQAENMQDHQERGPKFGYCPECSHCRASATG